VKGEEGEGPGLTDRWRVTGNGPAAVFAGGARVSGAEQGRGGG
jgi:hypothetical protein